MQLGEAKQVGALEDERVGIGDVQPTLHDRGADEDVELLLPEAHDEPLEEMLVHLAVGDLDARLWYELAQPRRRLLDGLDPIVDVEDLSLAEQLAPDRRRYLLVVVGADEGQHRVAFLRRRRDGGHLPDTGDGHFERARDRRRRHGQDIDRSRKALRCSLCSTPKRCSSSTITRPRSLNETPAHSSRCVPITMSIEPSASPRTTSFASLSVWNLDSALTTIGKFAYRSPKVEMCCWTSKVVGTRTATCLPSCTALNAARTAISVLP